MQSLSKSLAVGAAAGIATYFASQAAMGYTSAFAMPADFPLQVWEALVVFGFGATLPALLAQFLALRSVAAGVVSAAGGFLATVLVALALSGQLAVSYHVLVAWLAGVVLASAVNHWLRSNNSSKPTPLRGAA